MSNSIRISVALALVIATAGCGKAEETPAARKPVANTPAETAAPESVVSAPSAEPESIEITYRPVNAKLRLSGESVVIMVPDTMDIESGRMLEYREAADGTLYLKSVIPN